jgi:hypothetical protein
MYKKFWEELVASFALMTRTHRKPKKLGRTYRELGALINLLAKVRQGNTDRQQGDIISLLLFFFHSKESRLKTDLREAKNSNREPQEYKVSELLFEPIYWSSRVGKTV